MPDTHTDDYLQETAMIAASLDRAVIALMAELLAALQQRGGRLFCVGVGGSAANASHAAADFRKLAGIDALSASDNMAELTARTNDDGWAETYADWLRISRIGPADMLLVLSVGGGSTAPLVSPNIVRALDYARTAGATIIGIVGRDGGHTARLADACLVIPTVNPGRVTAHAESFQAIVLHLLVTHPSLGAVRPKWESIA